MGGSYGAAHGHGASASISGIEEFSTPISRRTTLGKSDVSSIPTPTGIPISSRRQSSGLGASAGTGNGGRRTSSGLGFRDIDERADSLGDMGPPKRRATRVTAGGGGIGETY